MDFSDVAAIDFFRVERSRGRQRCFVWLSCIALVIALPGCSKSPDNVAPVTGRVLIDGKPFTGGKVQFAPVATGEITAGRPGFGLLDEQGEFVLTTYSQGDGAIVGQHWVTLLALPDRRTEADRNVPNFRRLPAMKTPFEVAAGQQNRFEIDLTLDQVREYAN